MGNCYSFLRRDSFPPKQFIAMVTALNQDEELNNGQIAWESNHGTTTDPNPFRSGNPFGKNGFNIK